jgi:type IV pilus assembly protein PilO
MNLSLNKLPWYAQLIAFVVVSAIAAGGFWYYYVGDAEAALAAKETRLRTLRADIARGVQTARQLPEFQAQVTDLERRLDTLRAVLPEQKDVGEILRRVQGLAAQSNLKIEKFSPQEPKPDKGYVSLPFKIQAEGKYHDLGAFFDRIRTFPRIIQVGDISIKAKQNADPTGPTIVAECTATTFVLQDAPAKPAGPPAPGAPKVP